MHRLATLAVSGALALLFAVAPAMVTLVSVAALGLMVWAGARFISRVPAAAPGLQGASAGVQSLSAARAAVVVSVGIQPLSAATGAVVPAVTPEEGTAKSQRFSLSAVRGRYHGQAHFLTRSLHRCQRF